jgi:hypothetical protein
MRKRDLVALLGEARDLLHHTGGHVKMSDGSYAPCPACDMEKRIDDALQDGEPQP